MHNTQKLFISMCLGLFIGNTIQAMDRNDLRYFDYYMQNGDPCECDELPTTDRELEIIRGFIQAPYGRVPANPANAPAQANPVELTDDRITALAAQVPLLKAERDLEDDYTITSSSLALYNSVFSAFITSCSYKQRLLNRIIQENLSCKQHLKEIAQENPKHENNDLNLLSQQLELLTLNNSNQLSQDFKSLEKIMAQCSNYLTTARSCGAELYLITRHSEEFHSLRLPSSYVKLCKKHPSNLVSHMENAGSDNILRNTSKEKRENNPLVALNPTSMAIVRHQLNKGFEGLEYKKDTAYTGKPLCRVKIQGEKKSQDWDFKTFMETLKLAELE